METFDGSKNSMVHLETYKASMNLHAVLEEIVCKAFPTTLKGSSRIWFKKLKVRSIGTFTQLNKLIIRHFIGG